MIESEMGKKFDDPELRDRFSDIVEVGQRIFGQSALVEMSREVTAPDLIRIGEFLGECSPIRTGWRLEKGTHSIESRLSSRKYVDWSTFGNWADPGGPLESFHLASESSALILDLLRSNPRAGSDSDYVDTTISKLSETNPDLLRAAGLLHDSGRLLTHLFLTNEKLGDLLLKKIGIRDDIVSILPQENVMQIESTEDMDDVLNGLDPRAVIIRIADEFGKRYPGSNRLYQPSDYDSWNRQEWARNYVNRPKTGRASDRVMRKRMPLHVNNVPRYFAALDNWVRGISTIDGLDEIASTLNAQLSPVLAPLPKN